MESSGAGDPTTSELHLRHLLGLASELQNIDRHFAHTICHRAAADCVSLCGSFDPLRDRLCFRCFAMLEGNAAVETHCSVCRSIQPAPRRRGRRRPPPSAPTALVSNIISASATSSSLRTQPMESAPVHVRNTAASKVSLAALIGSDEELTAAPITSSMPGTVFVQQHAGTSIIATAAPAAAAAPTAAPTAHLLSRKKQKREESAAAAANTSLLPALPSSLLSLLSPTSPSSSFAGVAAVEASKQQAVAQKPRFSFGRSR